jgi:hypothetical protein
MKIIKLLGAGAAGVAGLYKAFKKNNNKSNDTTKNNNNDTTFDPSWTTTDSNTQET